MRTELLIKIVEKSDKDFVLALVPAPTLIKFAELIVQECLFIVDDERKPDMVSRTELWHQIREHFGV